MTILLLIALVQAPVAGGSCRSDPSASASRDVRAAAAGIIDADNRGALEEVMAFYAADAAQWPPDGPPVRGAAAIRPRYARLFDEFTVHITSEIHRLCADERLAIVEGRNEVEKRRKTTGERTTARDVFTMILEKRDGRWQITHLVWAPG